MRATPAPSPAIRFAGTAPPRARLAMTGMTAGRQSPTPTRSKAPGGASTSSPSRVACGPPTTVTSPACLAMVASSIPRAKSSMYRLNAATLAPQASALPKSSKVRVGQARVQAMGASMGSQHGQAQIAVEGTEPPGGLGPHDDHERAAHGDLLISALTRAGTPTAQSAATCLATSAGGPAT